MAESSSDLAVIAIDFGTSFCGYAFSLAAAPEYIRTYSPCAGSIKTPTVLLTDGSTKFVALGYHALEKYSTMSDEEAKSHRLFQGFKMALHYEKDLNQHTLIKDSSGNPGCALNIFAMVLEELANLALKAIWDASECDLEELKQRIRWVITMPVVWTDAANRFMMEAAYRSGITKSTAAKNLFLALKPEAAFLYCRSVPVKSAEGAIYEMKVGDQYLLLRCGGGTFDATAYAIRGKYDIEEICIANGGAIGAAMVDDKFIKLLDKIFGKPFMDKYKSLKKFIGLMAEFKAKKKKFNVSEESFELSITGILEFYQEHFQRGTGQSVKELYDEIVTTEYKGLGVKIQNGKLQIPTSVLMEIITCVVNDVIEHTTQILKKPELRGVKRILMVGGFSDCTILRKAIDDTFGGRYTVMFPDDAWSAVLKGAVMFGHNPSAISLRIARKTYGIDIVKLYDRMVHDRAKHCFTEGKKMCKDVFDVLVKQGDALTNDMPIRKKFQPLTASQQKFNFGIFATSSKTPKYIDEPGVEKIGSITMKLPGAGFDRPVEVAMYFGRSAIKVEARDPREGGELKTTEVDL